MIEFLISIDIETWWRVGYYFGLAVFFYACWVLDGIKHSIIIGLLWFAMSMSYTVTQAITEVKTNQLTEALIEAHNKEEVDYL